MSLRGRLHLIQLYIFIWAIYVGPEEINNMAQKQHVQEWWLKVLLPYILVYRYTGSVQKVK